MTDVRVIVRWVVVASVLAAISLSECRADRIELTGGGSLRGIVTPDPDRAGHVLIQTETSAIPISFRKDQVGRVTKEASALDAYVEKRDKAEETAQAQYDLGEWCESHKLTGPAALHYRRAVELDKSFAPARKKLGHRQIDGQWMTPDEARQAQGMIRYKSKWVTREEKDRIDAKGATSSEQTSWARRIRVHRQAILFGSAEARSEAEKQLTAIREPTAIAPLVKILGGDPEPMRILLDQALGLIPGPEATAALASRVMTETDPTVLQSTMDELARRRDPDAAAPFLRALRSNSQAVIGRAAWALANLDAKWAVPKLIAVLVKVQEGMVMAPAENVPAPNNMSATFGSAVPGSYIGPMVPVLTGPVVGPGVVAFGATSVPLGVYANLSDGGVPFAGTGRAPTPQPQYVRVVHRNEEVLAALEKLTGRNFGFDVASWRRWAAVAFRPEAGPVRRVQQP